MLIFFQPVHASGSSSGSMKSKCEFEDVGHEFRSSRDCENESVVLSRLGCLDANGKTFSRCTKMDLCNRCAAPSVQKYVCKSFQICVVESLNQSLPHKKTQPESAAAAH